MNKSTRDPFVSLGHEMAHIQDAWQSTYNDSEWIKVKGKSISNAEKYATHIENMIRSEHGLPIRTHYVADYSSSYPRGVEGSEIVNVVKGNAYSNFYKQPVGLVNPITGKASYITGGFPYKY